MPVSPDLTLQPHQQVERDQAAAAAAAAPRPQPAKAATVRALSRLTFPAAG